MRARGVIAGWLVAAATAAVVGPAVAGPVDEVPAPLLPFEPMIGGWKGTASPAANRVKGWPEAHGWAWKFEKGRPVGLSVTFDGDKAIARGQIRYDEAARKYHLDGLDPQGKPVSYLGAFNPEGKVLTFDRVGAAPEGGKERLVIRPNANKIRYTLQLERQEPGAPQYKKAIEVGLTKEGEAFAAGSGGGDLPKCVMTGGAAGMSVSYQGKTYPVCCSGCKDEFNDNPEKYAKLADAALAKAAKDPSAATRPAAGGKDDGSFDGLIEGPKAKSTGSMPKAAPKEKAEPAAEAEAAKPKDDPEAKANRDVQLGQNFEKNGKNSAALDQYRKVVKDHPGTAAAKAAATRIKALEGK